MGLEIHIRSKSIAKICNWDEINVENLKDVNNLVIYVDKINKEAEEDIRKIGILKSLSTLKNIQIRSKNPKYITYFDTLLKEISVSKTALLIDDFENKDRSDINFKGLNYEEIGVPPEYSQWGIQFEHYMVPAGSIWVHEDDFVKQNMEILEKEIDEWVKIPNLTLVDKVVLVANYLQRNMQYVQGEVSYAKGKKYIAKGIQESDYGSYESAATMLKYHIGHCQAFSKIAMLMLNNPKMNVNCRLMGAPGHAYNIIYGDEKAYGFDATWGVTRNPNRVEGNLKATEFFDRFVLFGQKELEEMNQPVDHHTPNLPLKMPLQTTQLSREEIRKSRKKLERYGIEFTYPAITYVEQVEVDGNTILPSEIEKTTADMSVEQKEKAQAIVNQDVKKYELEENKREGVSIDGE